MLFERLFARAHEPFAALPGPKPCFPLGNALDFIGKKECPWEVFSQYGQRFGGMSVMWILNQPSIVLHDPALISEVLITRRDQFYKDEPCGALIPVLTRSSPNINNGVEWTRTRSQSPLTQPWMAEWRSAQMPALRSVLRRWADRMVEGSQYDDVKLHYQMQRVTFDCFSMATVGRELSNDNYTDFMTIATHGSQRMLTPCRPSPELKPDGQRARKRFLKVLRDCYDVAAASPKAGAFDLLSMALRHQTQLPPDELSAEMGNVYYGGCFSVPSTLVSTLYLLTHNPEEMLKLKAAIAQLGDDCDLETLSNCKPLDNALREGMRLLPAVPMFGRRVLPTTGTKLGGHHLPQNTSIWMVNWLLQRSAPQWQQPLEYMPDRWNNGVAEANPLGSDHFFPEGRGPRMCLGADYSIFYMRLVLATLLGRWDVECGRGQADNDGQKFFFGVRMPLGLLANVRKRK